MLINYGSALDYVFALLPEFEAAAPEGLRVEVADDGCGIEPENLDKYSGVRKHSFGRADEQDQIGQVKGLAVTSVGGEEQLTNFYLPSELVGLDGIDESVYPGSMVALETTIFSQLGLPAPRNAEALDACLRAVRDGGAVPAITGVNAP